MSVFDAFVPPSPSPASTPPVAAPERLRRVSRYLRRRLLAVNAAVSLVVFLLAQLLGARLGTALFGPCTLGMLLLALEGVTLLASAAWYERASGTRADPLATAAAGTARATGRART